MSDSFVSDPLEAVKVGDIIECKIIALDEDRRRISLSRKTGEGGAKLTAKQRGEVKKLVIKTKDGKTLTVKSAAGSPALQGEKRPDKRGERRLSENRPRKDDDGTKYNPFAALLKGR